MTRTRPPQPQVSVIVPVYNQEQYLEECISSIRRQTLAEWECIIVNDGSSDSSGEIARRFSEEDSRIRCFEQENRGVSSARNLGMRHASGRYLCFVDGDDFIDAAFLKHLLDASDRGASDLTVAGKLFCDRFPPDKIPTLAGYFPSAGYEAVIVSFGSHVTNKVSAISVDDFRKNYMAFVSQLSKRCRFLILATSTSIMDGPDGTLNEEKEKIITAFNAIVREAASSLPGAVLSDHHDFMQGRRYIDPFHFSPPDRAYQAGKTAGLLLPLLSARQEPPKEQECPQSRPEP